MCGLPPPPPMGEAVFFNVTRAATSIYKQSSKVMNDDSRLRHPLSSSDEGGLYGAGNVRKELSRRRLASARPRPQDSTHCEGFVG